MTTNKSFISKNKTLIIISGIVSVLHSLVLADHTLHIFHGSLAGVFKFLFPNIYISSIILLLSFLIISLILIYNLYSKVEAAEFNEHRKKEAINAFVRFIADFSFEDKKSPKTSRDKEIDSFLTKILTCFPNNKYPCRIVLATPEKEGTFKIINSINIEPWKKDKLEAEANWMDEKTLFAYGYRRQKENFKIYYNGDLDEHYLKTTPSGKKYESTVTHMIIPLRDKTYPKYKDNLEGCLAVLIISSTDKKGLIKEKEAQYYNTIHASVKSIEGVLLQYDFVQPRMN
jgi:hypothetical protein